MKDVGDYSRNNYGGRNIWFGVREFAMGCAVNGMALHGGLKVFGATFFVFSDYLRPAIRLAALMNLPVIYVFTHDSIAVGEDGPTHEQSNNWRRCGRCRDCLSFVLEIVTRRLPLGAGVGK